ncbi:unnamed protein product [Sphenostylis stenocarpa]|uniref:Uncharacterized protein n=1 Tax=Sphenostylis stenocarpa TaxID=92480 RepID=A0AA86T4M0_9FABA|nr:unnamed protein product [Sphenostylis stenocarpa]
MSVNRKPPASNGRLPSNMKSWKVNEPLHASNSPRTCKWKPLLLWFFGFVAMGTVWFILSFNSNYLVNKENEAICEEKARILLRRYNVSREQIHALVSSFPGSDQVKYTLPHSSNL